MCPFRVISTPLTLTISLSQSITLTVPDPIVYSYLLPNRPVVEDVFNCENFGVDKLRIWGCIRVQDLVGLCPIETAGHMQEFSATAQLDVISLPRDAMLSVYMLRQFRLSIC